ncbi:MAG: hypothetical protein ABSH50_32345 [Bryobacteraceae bacterium]|jgi:hypothetical protein
MTCRAVALLPMICGVLAAQSGTRPRPSALDYPAHAELAHMSVGAEYTVHGFSNGEEMYIARDYLVVEVALFPAKGQIVAANAGQFALRINGRKQVLQPEAPEFVAASLRFPDPDRHPGVEAGIGPLILGAPQPTARFPGDPSAAPAPQPPRAPDDNPSGIERQPPVKAEDLVMQTALPEDEHHSPVSGFLYFPYRGKAKAIKSLQLEFSGSDGTVTLPLLSP